MRFLILPVCAALCGCTTPTDQAGPRLIASVNHSEWDQPNRLNLDLDSGAYSISPGIRESGDRIGQRRGMRLKGKLETEALQPLRASFEASVRAGVVDSACARKPRRERERFVVTNGGEKTLYLFSDGRWQRAYGDLECWTKEAYAFHGELEEAFAFYYDLER